MEIDRSRSELDILQKALASVEKRLLVRYSVMDAAYRTYLKKEIVRLMRWELVDATIAIYSVVESEAKGYVRRFQGFYDVDALRNAGTGEFKYSAELTQREIEECLLDFRARFGWRPVSYPAKDTSIPIWIETSNFEFIKEPKGADVKTLSVIEDEEETYFATPHEKVYFPKDEEKEVMKRVLQ